MSPPRTPSSDGLNNRFNSYQQSGSYVPPGKSYADQQTNVLSETVKTQYQTENTANAVLQQMNAQRQQIQGADEDVWDMRNATDETKRELRELQEKYQARKRKLYVYIAVLGLVDLLLFLRILRCRGSFFCRY
jgi:chlorite dismutase